MRVLIIDGLAIEKVEKLRAFAERPENYHLVGADGKSNMVPGDLAEYVTHLEQGFLCVFTITKTDMGTYRHLSISVDRKNKYPSARAAYTIAEMFGFTGWDGHSEAVPASWIAKLEKESEAIVFAQLVAPNGETQVNRL
jgi:hypothetical protein